MRQAEDRLAAGPLWQDNNLVFASTVGTALDDHNVRRQFRVITGAAGAGQRNRADARNQARRAAMTGAGNMHGRDVTGTAFYEWLLADHPDARAERDWRRAATHQAETDRAAAVRAWAGKINAHPDAAANPAGPGHHVRHSPRPARRR